MVISFPLAVAEIDNVNGVEGATGIELSGADRILRSENRMEAEPGHGLRR